MGKRGPAPKTDQAARGFPGRRRGKAVAAAKDAERIARLLAPGAAHADAPSMLYDPKYAPALAVWRRLAPELRRTHRLPAEAETMFMAFCIYAQEWVASTDDIHENGSFQKVGTVAGAGTGDKMERRRPVTFDRQMAFQNMKELSGQYGLTPGDMYPLYKDQALVAARNPSLFGDAPAPPPAAHDPAADDDQADAPPARLIGSLTRFKSEPPTSIN